MVKLFQSLVRLSVILASGVIFKIALFEELAEAKLITLGCLAISFLAYEGVTPDDDMKPQLTAVVAGYIVCFACENPQIVRLGCFIIFAAASLMKDVHVFFFLVTSAFIIGNLKKPDVLQIFLIVMGSWTVFTFCPPLPLVRIAIFRETVIPGVHMIIAILMLKMKMASTLIINRVKNVTGFINTRYLGMYFDLPSTASALPGGEMIAEIVMCTICLDILYEPCTTPCGHNFCIECLESAIARDRQLKRCPICRTGISDSGGFNNVNCVLWNTTQRLFPQQVAARGAMEASRVLVSRDSVISSIRKAFVTAILGVACVMIYNSRYYE